jgi:acyl-CoA synthetase (NDP forming)
MTAPATPLPRDLHALFDPASVAIVGASADPAKWGYSVARQALRAGERRPVHLVNRRGGEILGCSVATSLAELADPVELVVISVPAAGFESAVDDALAAGAKALVAITAGLGELGAEGEARQQAVLAKVRAAGALLVGPNCLGLADNTTGLYLSSDPFPDGRIALLSQSGNVGLELQLRLSRQGLGFSRFVSLGNQADVSLVELVRDCARHSGTDTIAVYAEDFRDGRAFARAAAEAAALGKPLVLLAPGGSDAAARSALSHTGSMTSPTAVIDAVCRDSGIHRVTTLRELAVVLSALHEPAPHGPASGGRARAAAGRRVAVFTDGGGHGTIAADSLEDAGFTVPALSDRARQAVRAALWDNSPTANPVDLAGLGEQDPLCYARGVAALLAGDEVDSVLMTGYFGGYSTGDFGDASAAEAEAAAALAACAGASAKPVVVQSMYPDAPSCRTLAQQGIPVFDGTEDAVRALAALTPPPGPTGPPLPLPAPAPPATDDGYLASRELFAAAGLPFVPAAAARTEEEVRDAARRLRAPYVLKATGLLHKSDAGGVALGLEDEEELVAAYRDMTDRLAPPGFSVEEMADTRDGVELIVGARQDPRFGPVLLVGLGGTLTEVLRDTAFALAPVTPAAARALLESLRTAPLLHGVRGRPGVDLDAVAAAVARISELAAAHPEIDEIEVNPLLATPRGVTALDARIVPGRSAPSPADQWNR